MKSNQIGGLGLMVAIGIILIGLTNVGSPSPEMEESPPPVAQPLDADTVKTCESMVAAQQKTGLVRGRPAPNRINVEDLAWAMLPADDKRALMSVVFCSAFQLSVNDVSDDDLDRFVVAYGYRSGERVAMLSSTGLSLGE